MHETVFASSLLGIVLEETRKYEKPGQQLRVTDIELAVGLFASLELETLQGCFELLAEDTAAAGARIALSLLPWSGYCPECGRMVQTCSRSLSCPLCAGQQVDWRGGENAARINAIKVAWQQ